MILALVAAPLIILGRPELAFIALARGRCVRIMPATEMKLLYAGAIAFAFALWGWQLPAPYDATFRSTSLYWAMHLSLFGAALLLWRGLIYAPAAGVALGVSTLSSLHMALLGALLTPRTRIRHWLGASRRSRISSSADS